MKAVLERDFVAVDLEGNELRITCLTQLIKDWGFVTFLRRFAFDFGKVWYEDAYTPCEWSESGFFVSKRPRSSHMYILMDVDGRQYSPDYVISLFNEVYPATSNAMWKKETQSYFWRRWRHGCTYSLVKRRAEVRSVSFKRHLWQASENLAEAEVKPVRKLKSHYQNPYEDDWMRKPEKNWKRFRKTQYK